MRNVAIVIKRALVVGLILAFAGAAQAGIITLSDGGSTVVIDPDSSAGVKQWMVGGVNHLAQQWFWFRTDLEGVNAQEYSIDQISAPVVSQPAPNFANITYTDAQNRFKVSVTYALVGAHGCADLAEIISFTNTSAAPITLDFFQYSDFDLAGTMNDGKVQIVGGNQAWQYDTAQINELNVTETVVNGSPDRSEVGIWPSTLTKLTDGVPDDLDNTALLVDTKNLTWTFQWQDRVLQPGRSLLISKDKWIQYDAPVPEPAGLGLIGLVLLALRKRRS